MKKIVALVLCLVMVAGLMTGCQKAMDIDTLVKKVDEAMAAATHTAAKMNVEMDMQLGAEGMTLDMGMDLTMDLKATKDMSASWMDMDMTMDVLGESMDMDMEIYMNAEGDETVTYMYEGTSGTWVKTRQKQEVVEASAMKFSEMPREKMTLAPEKETVNGRECYVVTINMDGEYVQTMMESTMPAVTDEATQEMLEAMDWSKLSAVMTYHVDAESFLPLQMSGEIQGLGDVMSGLVGQMLGMEGLDMTVTVPTCKVSMTEMAYTGVEVPAVPQEAIDNAVDADALEDMVIEDTTIEPQADGSYLMSAGSVQAQVMLPEGCTADIVSMDYIDAANEDWSIYLGYELLPAEEVVGLDEALLAEVDTLKADGTYKSHTGPEELDGYQVMGITDTDGYSFWCAWREVEGYALAITVEAADESFDIADVLSGVKFPAA